MDYEDLILKSKNIPFALLILVSDDDFVNLNFLVTIVKWINTAFFLNYKIRNLLNIYKIKTNRFLSIYQRNHWYKLKKTNKRNTQTNGEKNPKHHPTHYLLLLVFHGHFQSFQGIVAIRVALAQHRFYLLCAPAQVHQLAGKVHALLDKAQIFVLEKLEMIGRGIGRNERWGCQDGH